MSVEQQKTRLRVAFLHPDLGIGGAERLIVDAGVSLQDRGHYVHMFTSHHDPDHCFEESRTRLPVTVCGDWMPRGCCRGRFQVVWAIIRQLYAALCLIWSSLVCPFDVVVVDQVSHAIPLLKLAGLPVLFYCHFPDLKLSSRGSWIKRLYRKPVDTLEEWTTEVADECLVNSRFTAAVFRQTFLAATRRYALTVAQRRSLRAVCPHHFRTCWDQEMGCAAGATASSTSLPPSTDSLAWPHVLYPAINFAAYDNEQDLERRHNPLLDGLIKLGYDTRWVWRGRHGGGRSSRRSTARRSRRTLWRTPLHHLFVSINRFERKKEIELAVRAFALVLRQYSVCLSQGLPELVQQPEDHQRPPSRTQASSGSARRTGPAEEDEKSPAVEGAVCVSETEVLPTECEVTEWENTGSLSDGGGAAAAGGSSPHSGPSGSGSDNPGQLATQGPAGDDTGLSPAPSTPLFIHPPTQLPGLSLSRASSAQRPGEGLPPLHPSTEGAAVTASFRAPMSSAVGCSADGVDGGDLTGPAGSQREGSSLSEPEGNGADDGSPSNRTLPDDADSPERSTPSGVDGATGGGGCGGPDTLPAEGTVQPSSEHSTDQPSSECNGGSDGTLPFKLFLAGGYDTRVTENVEYFQELTQLCQSLGLTTSNAPDLSGQVVFLRSFTEAQRSALLALATAVLYTPSNEHFGIVPIEAMYAEAPVIACSSGGPLESVVHKETGFLCPPTPRAFSEAMWALVRNNMLNLTGRRMPRCSPADCVPVCDSAGSTATPSAPPPCSQSPTAEVAAEGNGDGEGKVEATPGVSRATQTPAGLLASAYGHLDSIRMGSAARRHVRRKFGLRHFGARLEAHCWRAWARVAQPWPEHVVVAEEDWPEPLPAAGAGAGAGARPDRRDTGVATVHASPTLTPRRQQTSASQQSSARRDVTTTPSSGDRKHVGRTRRDQQRPTDGRSQGIRQAPFPQAPGIRQSWTLAPAVPLTASCASSMVRVCIDGTAMRTAYVSHPFLREVPDGAQLHASSGGQGKSSGVRVPGTLRRWAVGVDEERENDGTDQPPRSARDNIDKMTSRASSPRHSQEQRVSPVSPSAAPHPHTADAACICRDEIVGGFAVAHVDGVRGVGAGDASTTSGALLLAVCLAASCWSLLATGYARAWFSCFTAHSEDRGVTRQLAAWVVDAAGWMDVQVSSRWPVWGAWASQGVASLLWNDGEPVWIAYLNGMLTHFQPWAAAALVSLLAYEAACHGSWLPRAWNARVKPGSVLATDTHTASSCPSRWLNGALQFLRQCGNALLAVEARFLPFPSLPGFGLATGLLLLCTPLELWLAAVVECGAVTGCLLAGRVLMAWTVDMTLGLCGGLWDVLCGAEPYNTPPVSPASSSTNTATTTTTATTTSTTFRSAWLASGMLAGSPPGLASDVRPQGEAASLSPENVLAHVGEMVPRGALCVGLGRWVRGTAHALWHGLELLVLCMMVWHVRGRVDALWSVSTIHSHPSQQHQHSTQSAAVGPVGVWWGGAGAGLVDCHAGGSQPSIHPYSWPQADLSWLPVEAVLESSWTAPVRAVYREHFVPVVNPTFDAIVTGLWAPQQQQDGVADGDDGFAATDSDGTTAEDGDHDGGGRDGTTAGQDSPDSMSENDTAPVPVSSVSGSAAGCGVWSHGHLPAQRTHGLALLWGGAQHIAGALTPPAWHGALGELQQPGAGTHHPQTVLSAAAHASPQLRAAVQWCHDQMEAALCWSRQLVADGTGAPANTPDGNADTPANTPDGNADTPDGTGAPAYAPAAVWWRPALAAVSVAVRVAVWAAGWALWAGLQFRAVMTAVLGYVLFYRLPLWLTVCALSYVCGVWQMALRWTRPTGSVVRVLDYSDPCLTSQARGGSRHARRHNTAARQPAGSSVLPAVCGVAAAPEGGGVTRGDVVFWERVVDLTPLPWNLVGLLAYVWNLLTVVVHSKMLAVMVVACANVALPLVWSAAQHALSLLPMDPEVLWGVKGAVWCVWLGDMALAAGGALCLNALGAVCSTVAFWWVVSAMWRLPVNIRSQLRG